MGDSLIVLFVVYIFNHRKLSYLFIKMVCVLMVDLLVTGRGYVILI